MYIVTLLQKASECKLVFVCFLGGPALISQGFCHPDNFPFSWCEVATLQAGTFFPESVQTSNRPDT